MAMTVNASIQLNDMMSSTIQHITSALNIMIDCMERTDAAVNTGFDSAKIYEMRQHIDTANAELAETAERLDKINNKANGAANATRDVVDESDSWLDKITKIGAGYLSLRTAIDGIKFTVNYGDDLTMLLSRLNLMNDGTQTTAELFDKIFLSAQDARGSVTDMAAVVARFGNNAKDAFSGNDEVIKFANLVQKQMTIAGATTSEASNAILQLSQGLGSGVLRGDELNSVFENAPNLIQNIADYLDVPIGEIRDMASDGEITADIVKNAVMAAADDIEAKFNSMPVTWEQTFNKFKNTAVDAFSPVSDKISEIINTQEFQDSLENMGESLSVIADAVTDIIDGISSVAEFVSDNWDLIAPILGAIAAIVALYYTLNTIEGVINLCSKAAAMFSAVWAACPTLVIIIGIIAVIYLVIAVINRLTGKTYSATGFICGCVLTVWAVIWNIAMAIADLVMSVVNIIINLLKIAGNFLANVFKDPVASVIYLFRDLANTVLSFLQSIAASMDKIFGTNQADVVGRWMMWVDDKAERLVNKLSPNTGYEKVFDIETYTSEDLFGVNRLGYKESYMEGYNWGSNLFDFSKKEYGPYEGFDNLLSGIDTSSLTESTDETAKNTKKIADNTDKTNNLIDLVKDNLEREAIMNYTSKAKTITYDLSGMQNTYNNAGQNLNPVKEVERYLKKKAAISTEGI